MNSVTKIMYCRSIVEIIRESKIKKKWLQHKTAGKQLKSYTVHDTNGTALISMENQTQINRTEISVGCW